jgi:hypothetical protein
VADEGWDILDSELRRQAAKSNDHFDQVTIFTTPNQRKLLFAAAKYRDIAMQSYARRAIVSFAAHDLLLPWSYLMADEPPVTDFAAGYGTRKSVAGQGYGPWCITGLEEC